MAISRRPSMNAVAVKNRARAQAERPARHEWVVGDQRVDLGGVRGANVGGRVERERRHVETHAMRPAHVVGAHGPLGRDEVVVSVGRGLEEWLVERLKRQQAGGHARHALPCHVEVGGYEALDQQLRARDAAREDRVHHAVRVGGRGVEVGVARDVLDLEVDLGSGPLGVVEQRADRDDGCRLARRARGQRAARAAEHIGTAAGQLGEREGAQLARAVRGAVQRGVVQRDRNAVLGELRVDLEHESVARGVLVRAEALLREARLAVHDGAAAVGVYLRRPSDRGGREGEQDGGGEEGASEHAATLKGV